jgi:hypothetical protein
MPFPSHREIRVISIPQRAIFARRLFKFYLVFQSGGQGGAPKLPSGGPPEPLSFRIVHLWRKKSGNNRDWAGEGRIKKG